ncbi:hypothetical protein [Amycolatopsis sp. WGS_07]|uniref:hypothetical protein n=1 Tax=Amycolatopsis sp. WGS_07 TaxID=3076764 RepID=UPI0038736CFA
MSGPAARPTAWRWLSPTLPGWTWASTNGRIREFVLDRVRADPGPAPATVLDALTQMDLLLQASRLAWYNEIAGRRASGRSWERIAGELTYADAPIRLKSLRRQDVRQHFHRPPARIRKEAEDLLAGPFGDEVLDLVFSLSGNYEIPEITLRSEVDTLAAEASARGCSWAAVGASLGISRQAAHRKYGRLTESDLCVEIDLLEVVESAEYHARDGDAEAMAILRAFG